MLSKRVENTVGKGEIARYEQFLLFPQCFQKACFPGVSKGVIVWEWVNLVRNVCISNGRQLLWTNSQLSVRVVFPRSNGSTTACTLMKYSSFHYVFWFTSGSSSWNDNFIRGLPHKYKNYYMIIIWILTNAVWDIFSLYKSHCRRYYRSTTWLHAQPSGIFIFQCPQKHKESGLTDFTLTLSQTRPGFYVSAVLVFWKHCEKRWNCSQRAISLFSTAFSTRLKNFLQFSSDIKLSSANSLSFEGSKFCCSGKD